MRVWLAPLLIVVLCLQMLWASWASYCGHESTGRVPSQSARAEAHFGHHVHGEHLAKAGALAAAGAQALGLDALDLDHGHCHLSHLAVLPLLLLPLPMAHAEAAPPEPLWRRPSHIPEGPERPDWSRA